MKFWQRHRMFWNDSLRWYERSSLVLWWLGQFVFAASFGLAFAVLYVGNFERAAVDGALGCLLAGTLVLFACRWLLALALRKRHRRGVRVY